MLFAYVDQGNCSPLIRRSGPAGIVVSRAARERSPGVAVSYLDMTGNFHVNISKYEQRVLHALAQGGSIHHRRCPSTGRIVAADCFTREGHVLSDCTLGLFRKLKRRGLISSAGGGPYRVTRLGLVSVRSQADNR